jgi:hypothetical protein
VPKAANVPLSVPSCICADTGSASPKTSVVARPNHNALRVPPTPANRFMFGSPEAFETQTPDAWDCKQSSTTEHPGLAELKILFLAMVDVMSGTILHF